jgi:hypothetical protein
LESEIVGMRGLLYLEKLNAPARLGNKANTQPE